MKDRRELAGREPADRPNMFGAAVWICAIQFFVAQVVVQAAWTRPFSLSTNFISDLGNTVCGNYPPDGGRYVCSPLHAWMNLSFSVQGIIVIVGTLLLLSLGRRGAVKIIVTVLLLLTGLGMFGVGLFTENESNDGHVCSAALQFVASNLALVIIGGSRSLLNASISYRASSALLGAAGLAATALFTSDIHFGLGVGGMERVAAYTFPVWLIVSGIGIVVKLKRESA